MIEAGAAGVHFEDQLAQREEVRHLGGKVLVADRPVRPHAHRGPPRGRRLECRRCSWRAPMRSPPPSSRPTSTSATAFVTGERTGRGSSTCDGIEAAIARALAYAPYADMLWCETSTPDLDEARAFAEAVHAKFPGKLLAYNCSPSFNWKKHLDDARSRGSRRSSARWATGSSSSRWRVPRVEREHVRPGPGYATEGMTAYVRLQQHEFEIGARRLHGREAPGRGRHRLLRPGVADGAQGHSSTLALEGSTEADQF